MILHAGQTLQLSVMYALLNLYMLVSLFIFVSSLRKHNKK